MPIFPIENPITSIPGLVAYYDARNINGTGIQPSIGAISTWSDLSGNQNTGIQGTGALQPSYNYSTFSRPSVAFDGARDIPANSATSLNVTLSSFQVVSSVVSRSTQGIVNKDQSGSISNPPYGFQYGTTNNLGQVTVTDNTNLNRTVTTSAVNTVGFMSGDYSGTVFTYYSDNSTATSSNTSLIGITTGKLRIGQQKTGTGRFLNGNIFMFTLFNRMLSTAENNVVRRYCANTYGIALTDR